MKGTSTLTSLNRSLITDIKKARYLWSTVAVVLTLIAFTLIPVAGSSLQDQGAYLPIVVNPAGSPTPPPSPTNTPVPTNTPIPTDTPIPTPTEKPKPVPSGDIRITDIFYDGIMGRQEPDEYVQIKNFDSKPIQLQGWTLRDLANHVFTFPQYIMEPGNVCRVYTNETHTEWCGFSYGSGSAIWNNGGDCANLRDSDSTTADDYCY